MGRGKFEKKPEPKTSGYSKKYADNKGGSRTNRILLRVLIVVLAILLVLMITVAVAMEFVLGKIGRYDDQPEATGNTQPVVESFETDPTVEGGETYETVDPDAVVWETVDTLANEEHIINILLIGQDARPGESRARSDTMILVSLNEDTNEIKMVSFMRDMYVQIPGYQDNRINSAYALGGEELLNETLNVNFGVQIDGNVSVNFEAFEDVIDVLGGVDIEIDSEEAGYMRNVIGVSASTGMNHFDGEDALAFARMRYVSGGDYTRTERQRRVIAAVMESLKGAGLTELIGLVNDVLPHVTTDLSNADIINYATKGLAALSAGGEMSSTRIPADDAHYNASIRGMSVLVPDLAMCQEDLKEFFYTTEE